MSMLRAMVLALVVLAVSVSAASTDEGGGPLRLYRDLPKDPLLAFAVSMDDPGSGLQGLLDSVGKFGAPVQKDGLQAALLGFEEALGVSFQDDLLKHLGPEIALAVDLPPIDEALLAFQALDDAAFERALGGIGLLADVRDARKLDRSLRRLAPAGETSAENGDIVRLRVPITSSGVPVYWAVRRGRLALGFSADWVDQALEGPPDNERLTAGTDFAAVFANLDGNADRLLYVNLPRLRRLVEGSGLIRAVLAADPEAQNLFEQFFTDETMGVGIGSTMVSSGAGVRSIHYGPSWLGPAVAGGLISALSLPELVGTSSHSGRASLDAVNAIAAACEGFSLDADGYPGPTEGWIPVRQISSYLEPVYIPSLPGTDGFDNPILYWSDGSSYRIMSMGRDGRMDQDWSVVARPTAPAGADGDIVLGNGHFMVIPTPLDQN